MNWFKKFWKKLTAPPPNPARVLLPRSAISPGKPVKQPGTDFVNFTPRAIRVVELGRQEAERLHHNFVGTEHLLLGMVALGQGVAVNVLANFGINLETLRVEVEKQIGKGPDEKWGGMIPVTPRVKKVLALAAKEAKELNDTYIGTQHILLGLLREGGGVAARVLKNLGLELDKTREEIVKELTPVIAADPSSSPEEIGAGKSVASGHFLNGQAQQALAFARSEAARHNCPVIGTEHLLLGLISLDKGIAARILHQAGLNLEKVGAKVEKQPDPAADAKPSGDLVYSSDLKQVLDEALKEADSVGQTYIGTEQLLFALISEKVGGAAMIFQDLGIDTEVIRRELLEAQYASRRASTSSANFTPRAQQVLALARKEADRFNHNFVGTEHLLLGLVALGQGVAVNVLAKMGINLERLRAEVEKQVGKGPDQKMIGNIPYTPRVKKVIAMAAKEAKALNHTYVGTEHILLGLLREGDGAAARVLINLGVEAKKMREEILKELDPAYNTQPSVSPAQPTPASAHSGDVAFSNFTPHSQQALALARREADRLHHNFVGTEHLFLGMMKLEDSTAIKVLRNMGVVLDSVRVEIEKQIGSAPNQIIIGNIPYTPRVKKVLALAAKESVALQHTYVGTEHILLGLLREEDGIPARILAALDVNLDDTRKEILKELDPNKKPTSSTSMTSPNLPQPVDTSVRYDVFCREQPDKVVVYRNVLFKSVRSFFPRPDAPADWEYAELEETDGQTVFVAKSSIVRFSPQGAAFEAEDI